MCGIVGAVSTSAVNQDLYDALMVLQHRGQDAAGIMTSHAGRVYLRKANGLVKDVFRTEHMLRLQGNMGIGHVRYPTAGSTSAAEAQPFYVNSPYGLAIVHNGNLVNADVLKQDLMQSDHRHINTDSDSEVLLNVFAHELQQLTKQVLTPEIIFQAISGVYQRCLGAYAVVIMIVGYGMVAFRDPHGIRPLIYGKRQSITQPGRMEHCFASESTLFDSLHYQIVGDVKPGEAIFVSLAGEVSQQLCTDRVAYNPCLFEYVYLARPDSVIDKILVYQFRTFLGKTLAEKIQRQFLDHDIDVVIPIPETSCSTALTLAQSLGLHYREGFVKNRYVGRTFIMPGQQTRRKSVRQKLTTIVSEFQGKNVLLVDDSIVRGTTSREIVQMARDAGAKKVYFASAAPEVRYPNVYGIDMPAANELVAHGRNVEQIREKIGADWLVFQDLSALYAAAKQGNPDILHYEDSVFTGNYITGGVTVDYLENLAQLRGDIAKNSGQQLDNTQIIDLYNS